MLKKTKIICTIGPSSKHQKILEKLIVGGMDIAR
ncbi:MAG: pyruvate kinase, partial [Actinobacteria bacterium]|nr:pyruvate kinase [Actinomycetota bacterium]